MKNNIIKGKPCISNKNHIVDGKTERYKTHNTCVECSKESGLRYRKQERERKSGNRTEKPKYKDLDYICPLSAKWISLPIL